MWSPTAVRVNRQRGAASVECAVCLPLIVLIVLGCIEVCSVVFRQQLVQVTAYETARIAAAPFSDAQDAAAAGRQMMNQFALKGGAVTVTTSTLPGYADTDLVRARVTLPVGPNRLLLPWVIKVPQLSAQCTMVKEKDQ